MAPLTDRPGNMENISIDRRELLSTHFLFRDLDSEVIEHIAKLGVKCQLGATEVLFFKGDPGDALYGVLSGRIRISTSAPSGKEIILSVMEPGDMFGEIALLDGMPRTADASALDPSVLFKIHRREFIEFIERQPSLTTHLLKMVCDRVRSTNEFVEDYIFLGLPARLAKRLLGLSSYYGDSEPSEDPADLHISQVELGQLMGATRETINRQLQTWRKKGWVELPKGHIKILDPEALHQLVEIDVKG